MVPSRLIYDFENVNMHTYDKADRTKEAICVGPQAAKPCCIISTAPIKRD